MLRIQHSTELYKADSIYLSCRSCRHWLTISSTTVMPSSVVLPLPAALLPVLLLALLRRRRGEVPAGDSGIRGTSPAMLLPPKLVLPVFTALTAVVMVVLVVPGVPSVTVPAAAAAALDNGMAWRRGVVSVPVAVVVRFALADSSPVCMYATELCTYD